MSINTITLEDATTCRVRSKTLESAIDAAATRQALIDEQIKEYLAKGGQIHPIPTGLCMHSEKINYMGCGPSSTSGKKAHEV